MQPTASYSAHILQIESKSYEVPFYSIRSHAKPVAFVSDSVLIHNGRIFDQHPPSAYYKYNANAKWTKLFSYVHGVWGVFLNIQAYFHNIF